MSEKSVIVNIEAQVRQLIADHQRLVDLCGTLTAERDALKGEKRALQEQVKKLDSELSLSQLSEGLGGESRNKERAKARINRLMREVDKCIALLNRPRREEHKVTQGTQGAQSAQVTQVTQGARANEESVE